MAEPDMVQQEEIPQSPLRLKMGVHADMAMTLAMIDDDEFLRILASKGIPELVWRKVFGSRVWKLVDHREVRECLDTMLFAELEESGIPAMNIPAEMICAFIRV